MLPITTTILILQLLAAAMAFTIPISSTTQFIPSHNSGCQLEKTCIDGTRSTASSLSMVAGIGKKYDPQWKKKETLAGSDWDYKEKGLAGSVSVKFRQGNETKTTMAIVGQPLSDVASQAGQFIKYGCGKGECGTCECLMNGKWVRPCIERVPANIPTLTIKVKQTKRKSKSSGKFYSIRSFFMGFYNNALGMVGFVKARRAARRNWQERQEYEDLIRALTLEKRAARLAREREQQDAASKQEEDPIQQFLRPLLQQP